MARIVEIIPTKDTVTCEEGNSCTFDFTVTNVSNRKLGVGAKLITEGETPERWLKVEGGPAWDLDKTATDKIRVRAQVPPGAAAGKYKFHLCVFSLTNSDEDYTDSSPLMIDVKTKPVADEKKDTGGIPWWIPVSIVMVLLTGGGVAWWALSKPDEAPITQTEVVVLVPKVTGLPLDQAQSNIESAGLKVGTIEEQPTEKEAPNAVWKQVPAEKTRVKEGAAVNFIVAVKPKVPVPSLVEKTLFFAKKSIIDAGLTVGTVTEEATNDAQPGVVIAQTPKTGEQIEKGAAVNVIVAVKPKVKVPVLHEELVAKGEAIANKDPLAVELRNRQPEGPSRRGFDIGMAVAEGHTLPGPGKDRFRDSLSPAEQGGFTTAVSFSLERNRNADLAAKGAAIAEVDPIVAQARKVETDGFYWLGFDIATGIFGDPAQGARGNTATGPGSLGIRDSLSAAGQRGFNASVTLHLSRNYKP